jgi:predicted nucleic acid-binding protein
VLQAGSLRAPRYLPVEVASMPRRMSISSLVSDGVASRAHDNLLSLAVDLYPFEPLAHRAWELRADLMPYDA